MDISGISNSPLPLPTEPQAKALSGMADAQNRLDQASETLTTSPPTPELVLDVSQAEIQFSANAEVLKTSQDNTRKLLDMLA